MALQWIGTVPWTALWCLLVFMPIVATSQQQHLQQQQEFTVSGHSSGGSMASQHFMAYSDRILGLGHFQAAPYACSKVRPSQPFCNEESDVQPMVDYTLQSSALGRIADVANLSNRPIFVFSGRQDSVVTSPVNQRAEGLYQRFARHVHYYEHPDAQHAFVTDIAWEGANQCSVLRSPFINYCPDYDMAGEMFRWLYGTLSPRVDPLADRIFPSEKDTKKLGQLLPFIAVSVFPQECMGQLAFFGPT
jgi:hypothetical protein